MVQGPGSEVGLKVGSGVSLSAKPNPNLVGGVAVGEALEDGAGERVAVGRDERVAEGVGLLPW